MSAKASILVVEDDLNLRELLVEELEDQGYKARGLPSVGEALSLASTLKFDLLITDVRMPGVDGIQGFQLLQRQQPQIHCIVMTGYADKEAPARAIGLNVDDYLYKPFDLQDMLASVRVVLESQNRVQKTINALRATPHRILAACLQMFRKDQGESLDQSRGRAYQALYVGIRSTHLLADTANGLFRQLEEMDQEYKALLANQEPELVDALRQNYDNCYQFVSALSRNRSGFVGGERLPVPIFRRLYDAVSRGQVTVEQLQLAPTLRHTEASELEGSPGLLELKRTMWGEDS